MLVSRLILLNAEIPILHQQTQDAFNHVMEAFRTSAYGDFLDYYIYSFGSTDAEVNPDWADRDYLVAYNGFIRNMHGFVSTLDRYTYTVQRANSLFQQVQAANPNFNLDAPNLPPITVQPEQ